MYSALVNRKTHPLATDAILRTHSLTLSYQWTFLTRYAHGKQNNCFYLYFTYLHFLLFELPYLLNTSLPPRFYSFLPGYYSTRFSLFYFPWLLVCPRLLFSREEYLQEALGQLRLPWSKYSCLLNTTPWVIIRTGVGIPSHGFYHCPWFSLFPTLGYYSALGFLFFPPLATISP